MERVYESLTGYRKEKEGKDATHVIYTIDEYNEMVKERYEFGIRMQEQVNGFRVKFDKEKEEYMKIHTEEINSLTERLYRLNKALKDEKEEVVRLNDLNQNLIRISVERANAKRKLKPKKEHPGYLVLQCHEYEYRFENFDGKRTTILKQPCWQVKIQSPYDCSLPYDSISKMVNDDLFQFLGSSLGIKEIMHQIEIKDFKSDEKNNFIFNMKYNQNARSGFWEVEYLTRYSIYIPDELRNF